MSYTLRQGRDEGRCRVPGEAMLNLPMQTRFENQRPTLYDVAAALGMAKSTVSQGLSGTGTISAATRERISKVAKEMGYEPNPVAQRLANKGNNNLVYLCSCDLDVGMVTAKIISIQRKLKQEYGALELPLYLLSWGEVQEVQAKEMRDLCRQQPRAIVYNTQAGQPSVLQELQHYQENGGIVICYDFPVPLACDQVIFDREHNAYQAARYLIERGHRRLGINLSPPRTNQAGETPGSFPTRLDGFCRAIDEAGLDQTEQSYFAPGDYEYGGQQMASRFLAMKERPTGVCIVNDYTALTFMSDIIKAGIRIPEEVSVVGLDNELVSSYCPVPLTSVVHPVEEIVQAVVGLLSTRLGGSHDEARTITIRGGIVERQSVSTRDLP